MSVRLRNLSVAPRCKIDVPRQKRVEAFGAGGFGEFLGWTMCDLFNNALLVLTPVR
jgi:hypothetical protein